MTNDQAQKLRVLLQEALDMVLGKPIAFVLVAQDEGRNLEIVTNAQHREQLPELLEEAARIVRTPPDGTVEMPPAAAPGEPPAPAHTEQCMVKEGDTQCTNQALGGLRVNIFPTLAIQKRYGKRAMLSLIMDLPTCISCMAKLTPMNLMSEEQWRAFSRVAQQRNSGILADRTQTEIVACPFDDPEYMLLRKQVAEKSAAANDSKPGQAAPQPEGAGNA